MCKDFKLINRLLKQAVSCIKERHQSAADITDVMTGFKELDSLTTGFKLTDLIVIAGRPAMGVSAFSINLLINAAIDERAGVAVFSMDLSANSLTFRMISSVGKIDRKKINNGKLEDQDWSRLVSTVSILNETQIFIDETTLLTLPKIKERVKQLKQKQTINMVIVDYLQLIKSNSGIKNREYNLARIIQDLKNLANELNIVVIILSQVKSSLEKRGNKRPMLSDLDQSDIIEQYADSIIFMYRDEVYDENTSDKGITEIIIRKQNHGSVGTVKLNFLENYYKFE